jgi:hypothetical protein
VQIVTLRDPLAGQYPEAMAKVVELFAELNIMGKPQDLLGRGFAFFPTTISWSNPAKGASYFGHITGFETDRDSYGAYCALYTDLPDNQMLVYGQSGELKWVLKQAGADSRIWGNLELL